MVSKCTCNHNRFSFPTFFFTLSSFHLKTLTDQKWKEDNNKIEQKEKSKVEREMNFKIFEMDIL